MELVKIEEVPPRATIRQDSQSPTDELTNKWKASIVLLLTIPGIGC